MIARSTIANAFIRTLVPEISNPLKTHTDFRGGRTREMIEDFHVDGPHAVPSGPHSPGRPNVLLTAHEPPVSQPMENRLTTKTQLARHRTSSHTAKDSS